MVPPSWMGPAMVFSLRVIYPLAVAVNIAALSLGIAVSVKYRTFCPGTLFIAFLLVLLGLAFFGESGSLFFVDV